jgi:hypothetical protein
MEKSSTTGLPESLKSGIESLSGMNMDHVVVHYNSLMPAQPRAHAYTQGTDIHVAPGQERNLPHEAWHLVQQKQGRVTPTVRTHIGLSTDEEALRTERELLAKRTPI